MATWNSVTRPSPTPKNRLAQKATYRISNSAFSWLIRSLGIEPSIVILERWFAVEPHFWIQTLHQVRLEGLKFIARGVHNNLDRIYGMALHGSIDLVLCLVRLGF